MYQPNIYGAVFPQQTPMSMPQLGSMAPANVGVSTRSSPAAPGPVVDPLASLGFTMLAKKVANRFLPGRITPSVTNYLSGQQGGMVGPLTGGNKSMLPLDLSGGEASSGIWGAHDQALATFPQMFPSGGGVGAATGSAPESTVGDFSGAGFGEGGGMGGGLATEFGVEGANAAAASAAQNAAMEFGGELGGSAATGAADVGASGAASAGSGMLGSLGTGASGAIGTLAGGYVGGQMGVQQGWGSTLGGAAGSIAGGYFGGPAGAAGGGFTGSILGGEHEAAFRDDPALGALAITDPTWLLWRQFL